MKRVVHFLFVLSIVLLPRASIGLERFPVVSTQELEGLLADREAGDSDFVLINTLGRIIADNVTIPGSLNIPVHTLATSDPLPEDHSKFLVFLLNGPEVSVCLQSGGRREKKGIPECYDL